jgi:hypothetical protein
LGDDEGLFIVVDINRKWYPTQQLSAAFYLGIQSLANNQEIDLIFHH